MEPERWRLHSDVNVKSVTISIKQVLFESDPYFNVAF